MAEDPAATEPGTQRSSESLHSGSVIDNFQIIDKIGEGAFGIVYEAADLNTSRRVAIKKFRSSSLSDADRQSILNEARKAASLDHKNIIKIYQVAFGDTANYLVMEFIDGRDLAYKIDVDGPLPHEVCLNLSLDIARGLEAAHCHGIYHLDIKPPNILITKTGDAVIGDFGLAIHQSERWGLSTRGTLAYMSPEQARSNVTQFDGRTDLWSLGIILYEMLTKRRPFTGRGSHETSKELIEEILTVDPKPPSQWNPAVPRFLEAICLKCLEKQVNRRFGSAAQLISALENAQKSLKQLPHYYCSDKDKSTHQRTNLETVSWPLAELSRLSDKQSDERHETAGLLKFSKRQLIAFGCLGIIVAITLVTLLICGLITPRQFWKTVRRLPFL